MKYIKLFEGGVENRKKTLELKKRVALLLVDYLNCFNLEAELYSNGRIGCMIERESMGGIALTKSGDMLEIEWSFNDYFTDELDILISWLKEKGLNISISSSRVKTYMNLRVNEIDEFMNVLKELIDSGEIKLRLDMKKYNL